MIYDLGPSWPFEHSPRIEIQGDARARDNKEGTASASASVDERYPEVLDGLKRYHCIPVGESYPFVTAELAEYLQLHIDGDVFFGQQKFL